METKTIPISTADQQRHSHSDEFIKGLWRENPVFVQVLGMCPTLAVTNSAINALAMGLATLFVLVMSNLLVSLLRHAIPRQVRIASYILIIATFVTLVDYLLQAISLPLHQALGAFVSLIVVNCIILGRAEAFASKNSAGRSVLDGAGMSSKALIKANPTEKVGNFCLVDGKVTVIEYSDLDDKHAHRTHPDGSLVFELGQQRIC